MKRGDALFFIFHTLLLIFISNSKGKKINAIRKFKIAIP